MAKLKGKEDFPFYFGATPEILKLARELRRTMTTAEKILWASLRNHKLSGFRFRRQHPVFMFIADFYCHDALLVIELDGSVHKDLSQQEKDIERTRILQSLGIKVIRFTNREIETGIKEVLKAIEEELKSRTGGE